MTKSEQELYSALIAIVIFLVAHLFRFLYNARELSVIETYEIAAFRRFDDIMKTFGFHNSIIEIRQEYKAILNPKGEYYNWCAPLKDFPSIAAGYLKSKKHEWLIFAFAVDNDVVGFIINKGYDNSSVAPIVPFETIIGIANKLKAHTVLDFHNHPNAILFPSEQDVKVANECGQLAVDNNLNYCAFLCGRGQYFQYAWWFPKEFSNYEQHLKETNEINGASLIDNYRMRKQIKKNKIDFGKKMFNRLSANLEIKNIKFE